MRLVLDTAAVVAAMRSPAGASAELLRRARRAAVTLLASVPLVIEYEAVCSRAEHRLAAGFTEEDLKTFLDAIIDLVEPVEPHFLWRPQLRDPGDELVLEAAVNGRAQVIATFNVRDFLPAAARFGIAALTPSETIRRIR
ncbi:MAG: putative toxin-antitoxin system toxin component, PIN family [Proteobacteria bacterium]|nr:putative toxin-antitoxin system toxin component, PIN family [Pseudomonadota bacterium]